MSMEKYGVVYEAPKKPGEKTASSGCTHPPDKIMQEGSVRFCSTCNKYLKD